jgi:hypothetical protein
MPLPTAALAATTSSRRTGANRSQHVVRRQVGRQLSVRLIRQLETAYARTQVLMMRRYREEFTTFFTFFMGRVAFLPLKLSRRCGHF